MNYSPTFLVVDANVGIGVVAGTDNCLVDEVVDSVVSNCNLLPQTDL